MKELLIKVLRRMGVELSGVDDLADMPIEDRETIRSVMPYTMTSIARIAAVISATRYIVSNRIPGDIVECGVWRGGSMMAIAHTLKILGDTSRRLYLYDTFEGMSAPTKHDLSYRGQTAEHLLATSKNKDATVWCLASLEEVTTNMRSTGYPEDNIVYVRGPVEKTLPAQISTDKIALLRLDTDWYESTTHELQHLYPLLSESGVLIIDDYGHWQGARKAVDEYFANLDQTPFLHRVDYTGRLLIKRHSSVSP